MENHNVKLRFWDSKDSKKHTYLVNDGIIPDYLRPKFPKSRKMFFNIINERYSKSGMFYYAIESYGVIAGGISYKKKKKKIIELGNFWIAKDFRGSGIGRDAVLALMEIIFKKYSDHKIILQTISTNKNAIKMAKSLGFQLIQDMEQMAVDNNGNPVVLLYFEMYNETLKIETIAA